LSNTLGAIRTFTSFRANLEAQNPTGNPAFSRGWKPTRELPIGHIVRSFHLEAQGRGLASPSLAVSPRPTLPSSTIEHRSLEPCHKRSSVRKRVAAPPSLSLRLRVRAPPPRHSLHLLHPSAAPSPHRLQRHPFRDLDLQ